MGKVLKAFKFDPELYAEFKDVAERSGLMVTEAFEKFMRARVKSSTVRFPDAGRERSGVEAEARVLLSWLRRGQTSYSMTSGGEEISIHARLLQMLSQVKGESLQREMEEKLKKS